MIAWVSQGIWAGGVGIKVSLPGQCDQRSMRTFSDVGYLSANVEHFSEIIAMGELEIGAQRAMDKGGWVCLRGEIERRELASLSGGYGTRQ